MKALLSVIVPIYNGEAYISKCIKSILNQTYKNLEIILINDGSADQSPVICDQFAEKDERIVVIHQENEGLSSVRNKGIQIAKGDYIGFVDSDDTIHPMMYEKLFGLLQASNADIAMCNILKVYGEDEEEQIEASNRSLKEEQIVSFTRQEALENLFNERNLITVVPWNKLYKRHIFEAVRYPDGKVHDDEFVIHHIIQATRKIIYTNTILYYYYHNENSFTNERYNLKRLDAIEALKDRVLFFESQDYKDMLQKGTNTYLHLIIIHYYLMLKYYPNEKKEREKLKNIFTNEFQEYKKYMKRKNKMELRFFSIHPALYSILMKIRKDLSSLLPLNKV